LNSPLYLGLISGTSADGIDAVLVRFEPKLELIAAQTFAYDADLRRRLMALMLAESVRVDDFGALDIEVGQAFAEAANALIAIAGLQPSDVTAIGSHGQTVRHRPQGRFPFTMQIGDPNQIAERTGVSTVADFRRRDMAAGGQGAPLVCALHAALFSSAEPRAILNIGGIANVTLLAPDQPIRGFDTGPGNCLMDGWTQQHMDRAQDDGGVFASSGTPIEPLLTRLLTDPFFARKIPKSTGREYFNLRWLLPKLRGTDQPADVQATLVEVTTQSIAEALSKHAPETAEVIVCGGGVHNPVLMDSLRRALSRLPACKLTTTGDYDLDPDFVEAIAFAWLAKRALDREPGNCPAVTGAAGLRVLGAVYPPG
jgi:anhydro-N-acetylmuramic acid kinase